MAGMPVSAFTTSYMFQMSALETMRHLGEIGYRKFTVLVSPPHFWVPQLSAQQRKEMPGQLAERGLEIAALCFPSIDNNLTSFAAELRLETVNSAKEVLTLAGEWGIGNVIVIPGKVSPLLPPPPDLPMQCFIETFQELAEHAKSAGTRILVENVPMSAFPHATDVMRALDALDDDSVGILYDFANGTFVGDDPCADLHLVKDRLGMVDASDTGTEVFRHGPIGTGIVPFERIADTLREIGYQGVTAFEMIVKDDPDTAFRDSHAKMVQWGWEPLGG